MKKIKYVIYNNGKKMISGDSTLMIWRNINKINQFTLKEHTAYLMFIKSQGFADGEIELKKDGISIEKAIIKLP